MLRSAIALALITAFCVPASAQVPSVKVYTDNQLIDPEYHCGAPNSIAELFVVARNVDFQMSAIDFSVQFPPSMIWLGDFVPEGAVVIGNSRDGIAIAWGTCCMLDPGASLLVLRPFVLWIGGCTCMQAINVGGYTPSGKTAPTMVRYPEFIEVSALGEPSHLAACEIATRQSTWGRVKALYR
jgi:hypothetical protein